MKLPVPKTAINEATTVTVLRKAGYYPFTDPRTQEDSFILRLGPDRYPRFHLYVESEGANWSFNLHIDQKHASYSGTSRHAGEYDGPNVERELKRIASWIMAITGYQFGKSAPQQPASKPQQTASEPQQPQNQPTSAPAQTHTTESQIASPPQQKSTQPKKRFGGIFG